MVKLSHMLLIVMLAGKLLAGSGQPTPASQLPTDQSNQLSPWEKLFEEDPDPPRTQTSGGSRGLFCAIAPSMHEQIIAIWSDRPLFLWRGRVERIEVRLHDRDEVLWSKDTRLSSTQAYTSAIYQGEALQPGQRYDWVIFNQPNIPTYIPFQVMAQRERDAIAAQLTQLETQLQKQGATLERIALAKAKYFARRHLWSDVLREAASVKNPSAALTKFMKKVPEKFCG